MDEGRLGIVLIEQIAFEIENAALANNLFIDILFGEENRSAKECVHAARAVFGDEDDTPSRCRAAPEGMCGKRHARPGHFFAELPAQIIIGCLADIGSAAAEA